MILRGRCSQMCRCQVFVSISLVFNSNISFTHYVELVSPFVGNEHRTIQVCGCYFGNCFLKYRKGTSKGKWASGVLTSVNGTVISKIGCIVHCSFFIGSFYTRTHFVHILKLLWIYDEVLTIWYTAVSNGCLDHFIGPEGAEFRFRSYFNFSVVFV